MKAPPARFVGRGRKSKGFVQYQDTMLESTEQCASHLISEPIYSTSTIVSPYFDNVGQDDGEDFRLA